MQYILELRLEIRTIIKILKTVWKTLSQTDNSIMKISNLSNSQWLSLCNKRKNKKRVLKADFIFLVMQIYLKNMLKKYWSLLTIISQIDKMEFNLKIHSISSKISVLKLFITNNLYLSKMKSLII